MWMHRYSALFSILYLTHSEELSLISKLVTDETRSLYMGNRISHFHLSGRFYSGNNVSYIAGRQREMWMHRYSALFSILYLTHSEELSLISKFVTDE